MQPNVTNNNKSDSPANKDFLPNQLYQRELFELLLDQLPERICLLSTSSGVVNSLSEEDKDGDQEEEEDSEDKGSETKEESDDKEEQNPLCHKPSFII